VAAAAIFCVAAASFSFAEDSSSARQIKQPCSPVTLPISGRRTFDILPGQKDTLDSVAWACVRRGDVVNIFHQPTPYKAKIGLRSVGTNTEPIVINGVTDAEGNRPVISFSGARTARGSRGVFGPVAEYGE